MIFKVQGKNFMYKFVCNLDAMNQSTFASKSEDNSSEMKIEEKYGNIYLNS